MDLNFNPVEKRKLNDEDMDETPIEVKRSKTNFFKMMLFTSIKENVTSIKWSDNLSTKNSKITIGYFDLLPDAIFLKVLKYLSVKSLGTLSYSNSKIRNFIISNFLVSPSGYQQLIQLKKLLDDGIVDRQSQMLELFKSIGLFLKKVTFVFPTNDRIELLTRTLKQTFGIPTIEFFNDNIISNNISRYNCTKLMYKCYSKIINNLTRGWGDFECFNLFETLKELFKVDSFVENFMKSTVGSKPKEELFIRHFYRMICATSTETGNNFKEKLFWLTHTFNKYSIGEKAKVLILIFGPLITMNSNLFPTLPYVSWWDLIDSAFVENGLEDLGVVLYVLYRFKEDSIWKADHMMQLFEELINTPDLWAEINVATMLYYIGFEFTLNFLRKKLKEGSFYTVATYICYLNIITHKFTQNIVPVVNLIDTLIDEFNTDFIHSIAHAYTIITIELLPTLDEEEDNIHVDLTDLIESMIELLKHEVLSKYHIKKLI